MKPETKKRLDHMIFMQRLKYGAMAGLAGVALLALMVFMAYEGEQRVDKVTARHHVQGIIEQVKRAQGRNNRYKLLVKLESGQRVKTTSLLSTGIPFKGERIDLTELQHKSGNKNYMVNRLISK